jgi:V8-like Glu-specific endopeptidase
MRQKQVQAASAVGLCLLVPLAFGCGKQAPSDETVVSDTLRFRGRVVEELPSGEVIRETAVVRGREFRWQAKVEGRVGTPEIEEDVASQPLDLDALSVEELAEKLRGLALYQGHQFLEAEPPLELARLAKEHYRLLRQGAPEEELERVLRSVAAEQGTAARTTVFEEVEKPAVEGAEPAEPIARIVHGVDDRAVFANTVYPHRVQIVFDNTGSTSAINGSEGSGSLIGRSTAMSVAHVFWNEDANTWEADHLWAPGFDSQDGDSSPWGDWFRCYWVTIPVAYTTNENQNTWDFAVLDFNVGCNSVDNGVNSDRPGNTVGWLGHYTASESAIEARTGYVRGYPGAGTCGNPGQACNVRVWGDTSSPSENDVSSDEIRHQADTSGGQSGSGFYHYADPSCGGCDFGPYLVGMHRVGATSSNGARRYNSTVLSFVQAYSSEF